MGARDEGAGHPAPAELEGFLRGKLELSASKVVVAHLLRRCPECSEALEPLLGAPARGLFVPRADGAAYDFFIAKAWTSARKEAAALERARAEAAADLERVLEGQPLLRSGPPDRPDLWRRGVVEQLLEGSRTLRRTDPEAALLLASLGWAATESIEPGPAETGHLADFQAQALGELGNAYRVTNDPNKAERILSQALDSAREGTFVDPLLFARLTELAASIYADQRRFAEAFQLLDRAYRAYEVNGEILLAARILVKRGLYLGYANDTDQAIRCLYVALGMIGRRDPDLTLYAVHNLLVVLADAGRFAEARCFLEGCQELYEAGGGELDAIRLRALEGRIEAGFGNVEEAERAFLEAREGYEEKRMPYNVAIVALDLAEVWLRQGRTAEILEMVEETLETFRALGIRREATAAVLVLRRALIQDRASARLLKAVAKRLKRLERK